MFKDLTDLEVHLLERALNTERNTINKEYAKYPALFADQVKAIEHLNALAEEEDMRRVGDRILNDQIELLVANEIAMNCGAI